MRVYDNWELNTLRTVVSEADGSDPGAEAWAREHLAAAEAQRLHVNSTDHGLTAEQSFGQRTQGPTHSNYSTPDASGASEAQERFIRGLCAEREVDADALLATIKNKAQASKAIDNLKAQPRQWATPTGDLADARPAQAERPATERQVEFLQDLLATRAHDYGTDGAELSFDAASAMITKLLDAPRIRLNSHGIRPGRYAYEAEGAPAQFYRVQQNGRIVVQAGPSEHPYNGQLNEALLAIQADVRGAAALYGRLIGRCGRCGLELTDETSRALGLGPICAGKSDW